jgi:hypothetical protein
MVNAQRLGAGSSGVPESRCIGTIGNHDRDCRVEASLFDSLDECLKIASAPGDQNAKAPIHGRLR